MKKEVKSTDVFDIDKEFEKVDSPEILAYVPQRQAAKKAAEHIKSGLVKPATATTAEPESDKNRKETTELVKVKKESEMEKQEESKHKSSSNSSTSSSSSSSADSSSSSSSSSESEDANTKRKETPSESPFSLDSQELTKRANAKDRPFLDKAAKSAAYVSSSESSDEVHSSAPKRRPAPASVRKSNESPVGSPRAKSPLKKGADKKPQQKRSPRATRTGRTPRTSQVCDRLGDADVGTGDLSDNRRVDVEKVQSEDHSGEMGESGEKKGHKSNRLRSPLWKTNKKLETELCTLEREILERKNNRENSEAKTKSGLNQLLTVFDKNQSKEWHQKISTDENEVRSLISTYLVLAFYTVYYIVNKTLL